MKYIVFDMEWNQPAWSGGMIMNPVPLTGEIIEIGAVKLDEQLRIVDEFCVYVVPKYYRSMNRAVQRLTNIREKYLKENGVPFSQACHRFLDWCGDDFSFVSWGQNDLPMLVENMRLHDIPTGDIPGCIDLQQVFARQILKTRQQSSLDSALELLNETGEEAHDALHDARNTVKVCSHLDMEQEIEQCTIQIYDVDQQRREFHHRNDVLRDKKLKTFSCPCCGEMVECDTWVKVNGGRSMALGRCSQGHEYILYLNFHTTKTEGFRTARMLYAMNDDLRQSYSKKLQKQMEQQARRKTRTSGARRTRKEQED